MKYPQSILTLLVVGTAVPGASAQSATQSKSGQSTAQTQSRAEREQPDDGAPPPLPPEQRMRRNGGSLARAQLEVSVGMPEGARRGPSAFEAASYTAVKAPEPRIIRKHDLVTVIVREQSEFKSEANSDLKKDESLQAALNQFIQLNLGNLSFDPAIGAVKPTIDLNGKRDWKGSGAVDRKDAFTTRIQAEVVDIKPNGNVVLQARTQTRTDDESSIFVLSGMIRAQDITPDNTVLSTQMYDLSLQKDHKGTVREATKRGWLSKLIDPVWPF